jgi:hypothetical protein
VAAVPSGHNWTAPPTIPIKKIIFMRWKARVRFLAGQNFSLPTASRLALGSTQPPIQWVPGAIATEVKGRVHVNEHSPQYGIEIKNGGTIPPLPHMHSWYSALLIKHRHSF